MDLTALLARQRAYYDSGVTRSPAFRENALRRLHKAVRDNEELLAQALMKDLRKQPTESYMCETGIVLEEIRFHLKHLRQWMRPQRVRTPLSQFPARSFKSPEPRGLTLILSPWNYPVQLCLCPLVGAISGGNCAVVKPSAYAPATSAAVAKLLGEAFPPEHIAVIEGGRAENQALLAQKFDYIFFTGSPAVGRTVMEAAAKHLTPVTLELGGKSPVIVDETANIPLAARRIAFGKVLNAGQTCVAPDYLLIQESVKAQFIEEYRKSVERFFPDGDLSAMPSIVNDKHFTRLTWLLKGQSVLLGGGTDPETRRIEPTLLDETDPRSPIMSEEIFGPILPMLTYRELRECVDFIRERPRPLALYLFTKSKAAKERILHSCSFGGGCINDTIVHLATTHMGFGGVGESGMGSYHGRDSFETFTHWRSILQKGSLDLPMRYQPYTAEKLRIIRKFLK